MSYVIPFLLAGAFCMVILANMNLSVSQRLLIFGGVLFVLFMMAWSWKSSEFFMELSI